MKKNEGKLDRLIRAIIGLLALSWSFMYSLWWLVLAVPALISSVTGFCWPYRLFGISTLDKARSKKKKY